MTRTAIDALLDSLVATAPAYDGAPLGELDDMLRAPTYTQAQYCTDCGADYADECTCDLGY